MKDAGESSSDASQALTPGTTIVLPAAAGAEEACKGLFESSEITDTTFCDVLDGVSAAARYRREVEGSPRNVIELRGIERDGVIDGSFLWANPDAKIAKPVAKIPLRAERREDWSKRPLRKELRIGDGAYIFRYFRPAPRPGFLQYLDDGENGLGHLSRAEREAESLASALSPESEFLKTLLVTAARQHDEGKREKRWQRAMGRLEGEPELAKLHPDFEKNAPLRGFRHEWESLRRLVNADAQAPDTIAPAERELWRDLLLHLVSVHHGNLRPSLENNGLSPESEVSKQNPLRLAAAERFVRLQRQLGPWRLAYLEALLKTADAVSSKEEEVGSVDALDEEHDED